MHEDIKFKEAGYFLTQMTANQDNPDAFAHNLSAFLSASRSVLQYALEEAKTKPGGQAWYDDQITRDDRAIVRFFRDQRNVNVHAKPVGPRRIIHVEAVTTLHISGSVDVSVDYFDPEGKRIEIHAPAERDVPPAPRYEPAPPSVRYVFDGWPGDEDVLALGNEYLKQLRKIVADGRAGGFLTA